VTITRDALKQAFQTTITSIRDDKIITPIIQAELLDPDFEGFTVPVRPWTPRPYDGKFHPSTHASWTALQLYYYLTSPHLIEQEQMTLTSVIAITQGHFLHEFLQRILLRNGILLTAEESLDDPEHNRTGHMDGRLKGEGLEIKTINDFQIKTVIDTESLREKKPSYYGQSQDYMDMAGLSAMRFFLIATSYPYPMSEFVVLADPEYQAAQRAKYKLAINAARRGRMRPRPCCSMNSVMARGCPVRGACEIGRLSTR
jgi:hypothetical protein